MGDHNRKDYFWVVTKATQVDNLLLVTTGEHKLPGFNIKLALLLTTRMFHVSLASIMPINQGKSGCTLAFYQTMKAAYY
ncbi:MAG: hypothetical protein ABF651_06510 [Sporolactobacillus sp.]